ncbi:MAG TPA: hypothetical protein VJ717_03875 [Gemmatimonadaceae bacterium]|nr:hypothetical protein [Gemmatimonadaceae bacterium]
MIQHMDVGAVVLRNLCGLYSNLVTRPTGQAVRHAIEARLADRAAPSLTIIDFSEVGLLDFSCADEVVGKLLLQHGDEGSESYFLVRGADDHHLEAIEQVLERYGLALVVMESSGAARIVGKVDDDSRRTWQSVQERGRAAPDELIVEVGGPRERLVAQLDDLTARHLLVRADDDYVALHLLM